MAARMRSCSKVANVEQELTRAFTPPKCRFLQLTYRVCSALLQSQTVH